MNFGKYTLGKAFPGCTRSELQAKGDTMLDTPRFNMFAHRSIYLDGWRAVCRFPDAIDDACCEAQRLLLTEQELRELDAAGWELYNLLDDPEETSDLAAAQRPRLLEMIALWYAAASRHQA